MHISIGHFSHQFFFGGGKRGGFQEIATLASQGGNLSH